MKIVFLDFDGVVNSCNEEHCNLVLPLFNNRGRQLRTMWDSRVIPNFIKLLELCNKYNYHIVISSTWRMFGDYKIFNKYFETYFNIFYRMNKCKDLVVGATPILHSDRGKEILTYINQNEVEEYIVIDDGISDIVGYVDNSRIVKTDIKYGLTECNVREIEYRMVG